MRISKMKSQEWGQPLANHYSYTDPSSIYPSTSFHITAKESLNDYRANRENGNNTDSPQEAFPNNDGVYTLKKGCGCDRNGHKRNPNYLYITYTPGLLVKQWMAKKDQKYILRLQRENPQLLGMLGISKAAILDIINQSFMEWTPTAGGATTSTSSNFHESMPQTLFAPLATGHCQIPNQVARNIAISVLHNQKVNGNPEKYIRQITRALQETYFAQDLLRSNDYPSSLAKAIQSQIREGLALGDINVLLIHDAINEWTRRAIRNSFSN